MRSLGATSRRRSSSSALASPSASGGTAVRVGGELARPYVVTLALRCLIVICGLAQAAGLLLFFYTMWPRIRPLGSAARERAGERF